MPANGRTATAADVTRPPKSRRVLDLDSVRENIIDEKIRGRNRERILAIAVAALSVSVLGLAIALVAVAVRPPTVAGVAVLDQLGNVVSWARPRPVGNATIDQVKGLLGTTIMNCRRRADPDSERNYFIPMCRAFMRGDALNYYNSSISDGALVKYPQSSSVIVNGLPIVQAIATYSYQIRWREQTHDLSRGIFSQPTAWVATVTIAPPDAPAPTSAVYAVNPFGIFITSLDWTRDEFNK